MSDSVQRWPDRPAAPGRGAGLDLASTTISAKTAEIYRAVLSESEAITAGNFQAIAPADLERLFVHYDGRFFDGRLRRMVEEQAGQRGLRLRLSRRMTSAGGTTARLVRKTVRNGVAERTTSFEIAISSTLLFQTFGDLSRTVRVNGIECRDRLEALQRVFEHELLHLWELLTQGATNCSSDAFRALARGLFGHTEVRHELVTQRERALAQYRIRVGDRVAFEHEGRTHTGFVNRVTRRATVLVEHPGGTPYSDGKRYAKYYIPLAMLRKADA